MKYNHNQICTKDNRIIVGNIYDYKEDSYIAEVQVIKDTSDKAGIGFELKVLSENFKLGKKKFNCWAATGHYAYSGMWRLFDKGSYTYQLTTEA
jgi:hypothetical protein